MEASKTQIKALGVNRTRLDLKITNKSLSGNLGSPLLPSLMLTECSLCKIRLKVMH